MKKLSAILSVLTITAIFLSCLEHRFGFTIQEDGSVEYKYKVFGDSLDLYDKYTSLPGNDNWYITEVVDVDTSGEKPDTNHTYIASADFSAGSDLPSNFAASGSANADAFLQFPTSIKRQNLFFLVSYIFDMTFSSREMSVMFGSEDDYIPEECKVLDNEGGISDSLRAVLEAKRDDGYLNWMVDMFSGRYMKSIRYASEKNSDFSIEAQKSALFSDSVKVYLHSALKKYFEMTDLDFNTIWSEVSPQGYDILTDMLDIDNDSEVFRDIESHADFLNLHLAVSNDLEDENFVVEITMPGKVTSTNADTVTSNGLVWEFSSKDFADSTFTLSAVSTIYHYNFIYAGGVIVVIVLSLIAVSVYSRKKKDM